ncbi:MAG: nitrate- and nitrite sensing domain-containing protein [Acidimicrobiia bacterium]
MLRSLRVRTRLMVVIAVPLALLALVAVPELSQRRADARVADRAGELAGHAAEVAVAVDALQTERLLAAAARAGAVDEVAASLDAQRTLVDTALRPIAAALPRAPDDAAADLARTALERLPAVRAEMDAAQSIVPWFDPYAAVIDPLLRLQEAYSTAADAAGGGGLLAAALVGRSKEAASAQAAQVAAAVVWGELRGDQEGILADLRADELAYRTAYLAAHRGDPVAARAEIQRGAVTDVGRAVDGLVAGAAIRGVGDLGDWQQSSRDRQQILRAVESARTEEAVIAVDALGADARRESTLYAGLMASGFLAALLLAVVAARSITHPLRRLTDAADELAGERLPQLVEALRHPTDDDERYLAATAEPLDVDGRDELGRLSRAFNEVQSVAVTVAAEQSTLLRKGISDLYVNLARRNQALIERQIRLLDGLEAEEQDPDALEHLYQLDHLATRMRRNAESLLVLAGAEAGPRRSRPLGVTDVVRAALSEVEQFHRVDLGDLAPSVVQGHAVSDVAHILAELLENATSFSPPTTRVRVEGARTGGSYQLMIGDEGIGMADEQLEALNALLADPPVTGLALSRSLGCLVAARLAARHGITLRLRRGEVGTTAYVVLPRSLIVEDEVEAAPGGGRRHPRPAAAAAAAAAPPVGPGDRPAHLRDAIPSPAAIESDLGALLEGPAAPSLVEGPVPGPTGAAAPTPAEAAPIGTGSGLPRRTPGAHAEAFVPRDDGGPAVRRSPDEVRALLSRYRSGRDAARLGSDGVAAGTSSQPTAPTPPTAPTQEEERP